MKLLIYCITRKEEEEEEIRKSIQFYFKSNQLKDIKLLWEKYSEWLSSSEMELPIDITPQREKDGPRQWHKDRALQYKSWHSNYSKDGDIR